MVEHLTIQQMAEKYPRRWLGINNIQYRHNDGITIASADVVYTDKSKDDILADREHSLCATQPLEEKEGGITTAPEFDTATLYISLEV